MKHLLDEFFRTYHLEIMDNKTKENMKNDFFNFILNIVKAIDYRFKEIVYDYKKYTATVRFDLNGINYTYVIC